MDIRNGRYGFEEIFKLAYEYQEKFEEAAKSTKLQDKPNMEKIENLLMSLYE